MDLGEQAEALSIVADELAHAGQKLERTTEPVNGSETPSRVVY
jgi:hypothetical protein